MGVCDLGPAVVDRTGSGPYTRGRANAADSFTLRGQIQLGRLLLLNIGQQVNDIQQSIDRPDLSTAIATRLSEVPVVALLGARRGGKTPLTRRPCQHGPAHSRHSIWRSPLTVKPWKRLQNSCPATAWINRD